MAPIPQGLADRLKSLVSAWAAGIYFLLPEPLRRALLGLLVRLLPWDGASRRIMEANLIFAYPGRVPARQELRRTLETEAKIRHLRLTLERMGGWRADRATVKGLSHWEALGARKSTALLVISDLGSPEVALLKLKEAGIGARSAIRFERASPGHSVRIPWFGVPVTTSVAPMEFARETGAAVIPVVSYRNPRDGEFIVEILPEVPWVRMPAEPDLEVAVNTASLAGRFEEKLRAYPADWPWWRLRFDGDLEPLRDGEWREPRFPR